MELINCYAEVSINKFRGLSTDFLELSLEVRFLSFSNPDPKSIFQAIGLRVNKGVSHKTYLLARPVQSAAS